ncbi:unnamed protein product [Diamesa tonsa]
MKLLIVLVLGACCLAQIAAQDIVVAEFFAEQRETIDESFDDIATIVNNYNLDNLQLIRKSIELLTFVVNAFPSKMLKDSRSLWLEEIKTSLLGKYGSYAVTFIEKYVLNIFEPCPTIAYSLDVFSSYVQSLTPEIKNNVMAFISSIVAFNEKFQSMIPDKFILADRSMNLLVSQYEKIAKGLEKCSDDKDADSCVGLLMNDYDANLVIQLSMKVSDDCSAAVSQLQMEYDFINNKIPFLSYYAPFKAE